MVLSALLPPDLQCLLCIVWCGFGWWPADVGGRGGESRRGKSLEAGLEAVWGDRENSGHQLELALTKACFCDCLQKDYHFEYTECDSTGSRWRVAIPNSAVDCSGLPDPVRGKECSMLWFFFDPLFSRLNHKLIISVLDAIKMNTRDQAAMYI